MGDIDWAGRMARLPDEDLVEIASSGEADGYHQLAVDAAVAELARRAPDETVISRITAQVEADRQFQANTHDVPLSNGGRVAFVFFGIFLFWPLVAAYVLHHRGYSRKAKEALWAIPLSMALWWAVMSALFFFLG